MTSSAVAPANRAALAPTDVASRSSAGSSPGSSAFIPATMRAVTRDRFGSPDVLQVHELGVPQPGPGQVLVRVRAVAVNPWDWHFLRGTPYIARLTAAGVRRPKHRVLGGDIAGEVVALGDGATAFAIGAAVYGFIEFGGFAEYVAVSEGALAPKPRSLSFEQAGVIPLAGTTALQGLRDAGRIRAGDRVLVIGGSGGVGTFAVQLAKYYGAHVTAVASGRNGDLLRDLGADCVIDYAVEDVTAGSDRFDLVLQLAGTASGSALGRILAPGGRAVMSSGDSPNRWVGPLVRAARGVLAGKTSGRSISLLTAKWNAADLAFLAGLVDAGAIRPVVDSTYELADTAVAIRHLESGRARGKVVISLADPAPVEWDDGPSRPVVVWR